MQTATHSDDIIPKIAPEQCSAIQTALHSDDIIPKFLLRSSAMHWKLQRTLPLGMNSTVLPKKYNYFQNEKMKRCYHKFCQYQWLNWIMNQHYIQNQKRRKITESRTEEENLEEWTVGQLGILFWNVVIMDISHNWGDLYLFSESGHWIMQRTSQI